MTGFEFRTRCTRGAALVTAMTMAAFAMPAAAQDAAEPSVNQVIVYGDQPCPESTEQEITVCVRQEDPYRIPAPLRQSDSRKNESWNERVMANRDVGATGAQSCSTVGPGGYTGCEAERIEEAYAEKENASDVRFGQLIAEERARRLAEIDEDAAAEQERVEQLEQQYEARLRAEREAEGETSGEMGDPLPNP
ncbi:hypothetical protein [Croceicoccus hydrothermalis]|uniref:hypothetical protein n=1 Tax=Croceicoccus hydrothermalis TaxID=2867964 RepID=UPI001EFAB483|nr:hypothetical protein [Croceicoccus hydrothermalis]